ncbi:MAG: hypothetical protein R2865_08585 [Deinococcales bacterium]
MPKGTGSCQVASKADSLEAAKRLASPALSATETALQGTIWGKNEEELAELLLTRLEHQQKRLSIVDVGSEGFITSLLHERRNSPVLDFSLTLHDLTKLNRYFPHLEPASSLDTLAQQLAETLNSELVVVLGDFHDALSESGKSIQEAQVGFYHQGKLKLKSLRLPFRQGDWLKERLAFMALSELWRSLEGF